MNEVIFNQVKLEKGFVKVTYSKLEERSGAKDYIKNVSKYEFEPHPDFYNALRALIKHMIAIAELEDEFSPLESEPHPEGYDVIGFGESKGGIILFGRKYLSSGGIVEIKTPPTSISLEESSYEYVNELSDDVERATKEVVAYIGGKMRDVGVQTVLFEDVA